MTPPAPEVSPGVSKSGPIVALVPHHGGVAREDRRAALHLWAASNDALREGNFTARSRELKAAAALKAAGLLAVTMPDLAARLKERAAKLGSSGTWGGNPRAGLSALFREAAVTIDPDVEEFGKSLETMMFQQRMEAVEEMVATVFAPVLGSPAPHADRAEMTIDGEAEETGVV